MTLKISLRRIVGFKNLQKKMEYENLFTKKTIITNLPMNDNTVLFVRRLILAATRIFFGNYLFVFICHATISYFFKQIKWNYLLITLDQLQSLIMKSSNSGM